MPTFRKPEHLCLRNEIEALFTAGNRSLSVYPLRATFRLLPYDNHGPRVKVLLSVSKRRLHHAVDRNLAKRQLREAYRLNKDILIHQLADGQSLHIAFIWLSERPIRTATITARMQTILQSIADKIREKNDC